jgi:hypothetical protein
LPAQRTAWFCRANTIRFDFSGSNYVCGYRRPGAYGQCHSVSLYSVSGGTTLADGPVAIISKRSLLDDVTRDGTYAYVTNTQSNNISCSRGQQWQLAVVKRIRSGNSAMPIDVR